MYIKDIDDIFTEEDKETFIHLYDKITCHNCRLYVYNLQNYEFECTVDDCVFFLAKDALK